MLSAERTVSGLVSERPSRARIFESLGIDYCCGGERPLAEACAEAGVDTGVVLRELERREGGAGEERPGWMEFGMGELVDHIVEAHHGYLREELPRLGFLVGKVAGAHGDGHPELIEVQAVFRRLRVELESHTAKEEQVLFPACKALEGADTDLELPFGSVKNPISAMMDEHVEAGEGLQKIRDLTDEYAVPEDACNTYRVMLESLAELERDTHLHVFKENSVLFPKAAAAEAAFSGH